MTQDNQNKFRLSECLNELRRDLEEVAKDGAESDIKFQIETVNLDVQLVASSGVSGEGGVKWWILSAQASGTSSEATTQKLSLKLKITDKDGADMGPIRSRPRNG